MWPHIKLIKALIVVLDTCKNDEIHPKMKALMCSRHYSHYKSNEMFSDVQGQLAPMFDLAEFKTHISFHNCPGYMQE